MAGECPHSALLETTLRQCYDDSLSGTSNHESYLKIIDDLKNDLEQMSCEVIMVQKECSDKQRGHETEDVDFENSLKELEIQNDRLEQALKQHTQANNTTLTELQTNNETLKRQIDCLQRRLFESDQQILHFTALLRNVSQIKTTEPKPAALEYASCRNNNFTAELQKKIENLSEKLDESERQNQFLRRETRKLTEELNESREKTRDLISQAQRVANLLKCQESHRMELAAKYTALEQNYEDQAKKLRAANNKLSLLDAEFQHMEKRQIEHNMERNLLSEEVLSLKEKHACVLGHHKSLQDRLIKIEQELCKAHDVIREQNTILQRNEFTHKEETRRWQETNSQLKEKLAELTKDNKKLYEENEKQKEVNAQQLKLLENFHKWKNQQQKAEQSIRDGLEMYQNYIKDMLKDKQDLLNNFHDLSKDYSLLQNELDRLKLCPLSLPNHNSILNKSERSIPQIIELVRRTTRRVSEQNSSFKDEEPNASRYDSSTTCRPSEETL